MSQLIDSDRLYVNGGEEDFPSSGGDGYHEVEITIFHKQHLEWPTKNVLIRIFDDGHISIIPNQQSFQVTTQDGLPAIVLSQ